MPSVVTLPYHALHTSKQTQRIREALLYLPPLCAEFLRAISDRTSANTRFEYARDLRTFFEFLVAEVPRFGDMKVDQFTYEHLAQLNVADIEIYADYLSLYIRAERERMNAAQGKQRKLCSLRSLFNYCFRQQRIPANIAQLLDLPKIKSKPILYLDPSETARLLEQADSGKSLTRRQQEIHDKARARDYAMLSLLLGTGIRVSECVGLDLTDLDMQNLQFRVMRKGGDQVLLYFSQEVADALSAYLVKRADITPLEGHENALFLSQQRRRITPRAVENLVKKYARVTVPLKTGISPHKLRSTFGTRLYAETGDIHLVAEVLGHANINTTRKHYAAMNDDRKRKAANAFSLRSPDDSKP